MLIIPAIDLRQGKCVRLEQGRKETVKVYDTDPVEVAKRFETAGAKMLHIVDLDGAFSDTDSTNRQVLRRIIGAIKIPVQFGGGLRKIEDVTSVLEAGVARVVIGTLAVASPQTLEKLLTVVDKTHLVVGIDARGGRTVTRGWEQEETITAMDLARKVAALGVERIVYTDVARDGMLVGPNIKETCLIARESGLKVTASGGVSSLEDLAELRTASNCGIDSVIIGKAIYEGRFTLEEALEANLH
jgi:phosphoribosylformimino-5-aminoimidazole carboxamide ribotide isomerase